MLNVANAICGSNVAQYHPRDPATLAIPGVIDAFCIAHGNVLLRVTVICAIETRIGFRSLL